MAIYYTKELLYDVVHAHKIRTGFSVNDIGINMIEICKNKGIKYDTLPFRTKALRGMASIGQGNDADVILLNSDRSAIEQNYDCCHEFVHLRIHRNLSRKSFQCIDTCYAIQDPFLEWQANEGAAELLVPYSVFIPLVKECCGDLSDPMNIINFKEYAADLFNVSKRVIEYRLESLKYEIHQYLNGVSLKNINILSMAQQKKQKISIKSLNDIENELFDILLSNISLN